MKLLLTGASGFVGRKVLELSLRNGFSIRSVFRTHLNVNENMGYEAIIVPDLSVNTNWGTILLNIDVVIHCAGRVHIMRESESDPLASFRSVNVQGTINLARQAMEAGVRRFVFVSSVKVNGESTRQGYPFHADDLPSPEDAYGQSKAEAEVLLRELAANSAMEVVIIRPPLVYGPGVKGNFISMMNWVNRGLPLPLGRAIQNRRSLVALDNLADLILVCAAHPKAANQTFLVSDGEDVSTTELLQRIGKVLNTRVFLLPIPLCLLVVIANLLDKKLVAKRLLGSLQVDIKKTCDLLDWKPKVSLDDGLRELARKSF